MLRHLLDPPPAPPDDERAFGHYQRELFSRIGLVGAAALAFFTVAWWPLDWVVFDDPTTRAAFAGLRLRALAVEAFAVVTLALLPARSRLTIHVGWISYAAFAGSIGYSLGIAAHPDVALLADANMAIVPMALVPLRLRTRLAMIVAVCCGLHGGFFLPFPDNAALPGAGTQISFAAFTALFTVALGEVSYRSLRRAFLDRRALERTNAQLADLSATLSARVEERTVDLRALATHLAEAQEAERRRIAHDLHDELGQSLTAMRYTLARLEEGVARGASDTADQFADLAALLEGTSASVRATLGALRPHILDELGIVAAGEWLCGRLREQAEVDCTIEVDEPSRALAPRLPAEVALTVFRLLQEATTNALRHGGATRITVTLAVSPAQVDAVVQDDGRGFDPRAARRGLGLLGLRERIRALDGELRVESEPGRGARLTARVPVTLVTRAAAAA